MARDAAQAEGLDAILCGDGGEALESARKAPDGTLRLDNGRNPGRGAQEVEQPGLPTGRN